MFPSIEHKPKILNTNFDPTNKFTLDNKDFLSNYDKKSLLLDTPEIKENAFPSINYELDKKKFLNFTET